MNYQQATQSAEPCIDSSQIDGLVDAAGRDGALEILAAFWRSTDSLIEALRSQVAANAADEASRTAHALKGSALNVGATGLSGAVRAIEERCRAGDAPGALALVPEAEQRYRETIAAFEAHLGAVR